MLKVRPTLWKKILLGYWIGTGIVLFGYLSLVSLDLKKSLAETLQTIPNLALVTIIAGIDLLLAATLWKLEKSDRPLFLSLALFQQLLSLNFVGALLIYFYQRSEQFKLLVRPTKEQGALVLTFSLSILLTLFVLLIRLRLSLIA
ncbi:hypothetical protein LmYK1_01420 [Ligilactobacillus murinus]|uniref:hypothetical protein n=1 Tax=Ligilactobacillus murinus TaxID=1622 RepID=UPI0014334F57|nr:hypothetical protein [Ligilactobacillus murinus]BDI00902.1 hypothetical protein LmYK1_01420 [Ligilactobacillus murinus]GFI63885.1 hypothetical protein IMSAG117_01301 [Lactobacillaceae bacterium]